MTKDKAISALYLFIRLIGGGYHPDTPMSDYVCNGTLCYTPDEAAALQAIHDKVLIALGDEIYSIALEVIADEEY